MEDRRSKKGFRTQGPPKGASSFARRPPGPDDQPLDIDESACFYDWHGQPLSGPERRARLEAFRASGRPTPVPATARSWAELSMPTTGIPMPDETSGIAAESVAHPVADSDERAFDLVWREAEQVRVPLDMGSPHGDTQSEAPVVATHRASERHQRTARAIYLGLLMATVALVVTAVVGILRSNQAPSLSAQRAVAVPAVLAPKEPVRLSAEPPPASPLIADEPSRAAARIEPSAAPPAAVGPNVPVVANRGPVNVAAPSSTGVAPPPAAALPARRPDDAKPAPLRAGPGGSPSAPSIVPSDSPKF